MNGLLRCANIVIDVFGLHSANYSKSVAQEWRPKPTAAIPPPRPDPDVTIATTFAGGFSPPMSDSSVAIVTTSMGGIIYIGDTNPSLSTSLVPPVVLYFLYS